MNASCTNVLEVPNVQKHQKASLIETCFDVRSSPLVLDGSNFAVFAHLVQLSVGWQPSFVLLPSPQGSNTRSDGTLPSGPTFPCKWKNSPQQHDIEMLCA